MNQTSRPHIALAAPRAVPQDVLRTVREASPRIDIHYDREGHRWLIGEVRPDAPRVHEGRKMLAQVRDRTAGSRWHEAYLLAHGFSVLIAWDGPLDGNATRLRDKAHFCLTRSEKDLDGDFEVLLDRASGDEERANAIQLRREYFAAEGPSLLRKFFRHAVSIVVPKSFSRSRA